MSSKSGSYRHHKERINKFNRHQTLLPKINSSKWMDNKYIQEQLGSSDPPDWNSKHWYHEYTLAASVNIQNYIEIDLEYIFVCIFA